MQGSFQPCARIGLEAGFPDSPVSGRPAQPRPEAVPRLRHRAHSGYPRLTIIQIRMQASVAATKGIVQKVTVVQC